MFGYGQENTFLVATNTAEDVLNYLLLLARTRLEVCSSDFTFANVETQMS